MPIILMSDLAERDFTLTYQSAQSGAVFEEAVTGSRRAAKSA